MSADPDNEFFSDGMTDDVIAALTPVKGLKVAARASSFAFKGKNADLGGGRRHARRPDRAPGERQTRR